MVDLFLLEKAKELTLQYFGRAISLYAPLYLSNYCENQCVYCGFQAGRDIQRSKLTPQQIRQECLALSSTGIQNILLLTGESREHTPLDYIKEAITIAKEYFPNISLEIYPLETVEYRELFEAGADGVTIYQETYNRKRYAELHLSGKKKDFDYRYQAPERIAEAGFRYISLGFLLGLSDWREDAKALFEHLRYLEKKYPGVEYALSFPRLQKIDNSRQYFEVSDEELLELIATARVMFPRVGINLSTRESPEFRDKVLGFGVTRMSAGSLTTVGGYSSKKLATSLENNNSEQFEVKDERSLAEIKNMLKQKGFDPVLTDWRRIS